jgi:hopanoid biosynthesis associated protein HpnK
MKRLIVNADDFGLTQKVNQAIVDGHRQGIITNTSLMANGQAFDSAVEMALASPSLGVGVHLNLTEGPSVAPAQAVSTLVDSRGRFYGGAGTLAKRVMTGSISLSEIETEFRAQIEKAANAGIEISHLDGHKHIHFLPSIFQIVTRLARDCRIKCVRHTFEHSPGLAQIRGAGSRQGVMKQFVKARFLALISLGQKKSLSRAELSSPEYFFGVTQTGFLDDNSLREIIRRLPDGASELMCHPGYVDNTLRGTPTRLLAQRELELRSLVKPEIRELIAAQGIELINYRQLCERV